MGDVARIILNQVVENTDLATLRIDRANEDVWFVSDSPDIRKVKCFTAVGEIKPKIQTGPKSIISFSNPRGAYALFYVRANLVDALPDNTFALFDEWLVENWSYYLAEFPKYTSPLNKSIIQGQFLKTANDQLLFSSRFEGSVSLNFKYEINNKKYGAANFPVAAPNYNFPKENIPISLPVYNKAKEFPELASILDWLQRGLAVNQLIDLILKIYNGWGL